MNTTFFGNKLHARFTINAFGPHSHAHRAYSRPPRGLVVSAEAPGGENGVAKSLAVPRAASPRPTSPAPNSESSVVVNPMKGSGSISGPEMVVQNLDISDIKRAEADAISEDSADFVRFFRTASPYIEGHRNKTFVIGVPGEVIANESLCDRVLEDIATLQLLGSRIVLVVGAYHQIEELMRLRNRSSVFVDGYRVTDRAAMRASMEAAGQVRIAVEARLSRGPSVAMIRRHERTGGQVHFAPAIKVVGGNFVAARRRAIVGGVDFQYTGEVRFVMADSINQQLNEGHIVVLNNLGYSAGGDVLNCNSYEVACMTAKALHADKLIFFTLDDIRRLKLPRCSSFPRWLRLSEAEKLIYRFAKAHKKQRKLEALSEKGPSISFTQEPTAQNNAGLEAAAAAVAAATSIEEALTAAAEGRVTPSPMARAQSPDSGPLVATASASDLDVVDVNIDLDSWVVIGCPWELSAAVSACRAGIKRSHLVDANMDGGLLLELFTTDGVGTMISRDFYEGCRPADNRDLEPIAGLLEPLQRAGILAPRSPDVLREELHHYYVVEREGKVLACGALVPLGDGLAEVAAFCVAPEFRGGGRGDSLLEYIENEARDKGLNGLVLLTTRTADWFVQRGFSPAGTAHSSILLPEHRRVKVNPARNSQLYIKRLDA